MAQCIKKDGKKVFWNSRKLDLGAGVGCAFASKNLKAASATLPDMILFYHTGRRLYFEKIACFWK